ncbi:hypothetical protein H257_12244 [Aphanomyces astaci]|uniref:Uncharacterized protein n=1 Tax=Aphanomyces astaci TaxID=112090 RepID=W4FZK8_APHAT|nr:hypothetical protein H257_12244 [Aphanomyces astaci]ETV72910.1 hypothetical protein H257_12244 [Aphanomyces astaci]KAF0719601.1 hypothetical protein AaE_010441 [Aphanomyces astaci]|eukprot:XP_009837696.1 hypothetical protein H257_12244 [Aphanomyces astaci]
MVDIAMSFSPTTAARLKRRRDSHFSSVLPPSEKCSRRSTSDCPPNHAGVLSDPGGVLTTAFELSTIQTDSEAMVIAAEMSIDFYNEAFALYNMMSDFRTSGSEATTMDVLIARLDLHVHDERILADVENVRNIYRGLIHVFVYLYREHYRQFAQLDMASHLSLCWHRLVAFATEYRVLDPKVLHGSYEYTMSLVRQK